MLELSWLGGDVSGATAQDYDMLDERLSSWTLLSAVVLLSS
jgi:hypothetical protein